MKAICVKCPAKINLTLEILNKREDGFHNIKSVMQLISLHDFLNIEVSPSKQDSIILSGNSSEIPYDESNLVYKAAKLYLDTADLKGYTININIEKNIPIAAGLAGGSTDAAGTLYGLNKIFDNLFEQQNLHKLAAKLGSDLNVCLEGGCMLATSRGEVISKLPVLDMPVTLIKPKNLGISAREAYIKYSEKEIKPQNNMTEKLINAMKTGENIRKYLYNDLEYAIFEDYEELKYIKSRFPNSIMSGSGSTYFILDNIESDDFSNDYQIFSSLKFVNYGVTLS